MTQPRKPLRLWPGVAIAIILLVLRFIVPAVSPDYGIFGVLGGFACGAAVLLWWLLLSRARWFERLGAVALMAATLFATKKLVDVSIATGAQGYLLPFLAVPTLMLAFVAWAVATRNLPDRTRRVSMVATILVACGCWTLVRTGGFSASFKNDLHWRWSPTPEDRLVAKSQQEGALPLPAPPAGPEKQLVAAVATEPNTLPAAPAAPAPSVKPVSAHIPSEPAAATPAAETGASWPGFRGPHRDSVITGSKIKTDWTASPPVALWRKPVGPGWSSFAVRGDLIYTQEQRGPEEVVACYRLTNGEPVWAHRDAARFWESNGGPGPRGTPTLSNGRVYTFGATGLLNVLNARNGALIWSRNAALETGAKTPQWGFASSPLVVNDEVIVAVSGRLAAYDIATGAPRWTGPAHGISYSSPQLATIGGVPQVLLLSADGATSVAVPDGALLWEHHWPGYPIVQPAVTAEGDVLMSVSDQSGTRRIGLAHGASGWTVEERWTSNGLKPYFNDFVIHDGHAFGFDGSILSCIDLKDGKRVWKGGRYGNGQLVLLPDQNLLLVVSEEGELALVGATPDQFKEIARAPALDGKTWNHPVLVGDVLLVRNGQEMAAFRLAEANR